ncbi:secreted RxLR effector peptide protein, putative [Phytophthora infestans T30-4]|uniref:RxLR effector protein n=2 Tax=Phytophthora infestans TaxID=4787 RepID=D0MXG4_PHYIT|nr:secreted RxLR effector peptide protein, putative [Phytophthora infestans T30-4]EEY64327.1 secreted RxLR effector peptide protein, putative [Phytophthora infestans T30-4]KAF4045803.1 RXLR domain-containing protein [Phytophthora infestans]KAF4136576.1 RXLR effector domain-containing protein [Phytophthora infestans]KAI9986255.1 hypothetical protein PInf_025181 [Phytophthora infestans]|eukprot:XP_002907763.1 secreted RxLR effector peptide protein, putative [Phytophthora infestans T30-4]
MRFYYVVLAVTATLLASVKAVSTNAYQNQISQTASDSVVGVKRSLRSHKVNKEEKEDLVDSREDVEERKGGVISSKLMKIVKDRNTPINLDITKLNLNQQQKIVDILSGQTRTLERFAKKLGIKSALDTTHKSYPFFKTWSLHFLDGKKPKKVSEFWI